MLTRLIRARNPLWCPLGLTLCLAVPVQLRAAISFRTDGRQQEQKYLHRHDSRTFVLEGWGKPVRNLDGEDRFVVYRMPVEGATAARLHVHLLNSFALSVSVDDRTYAELEREVGRGGSNQGWKRFDLGPFLPSRDLFVKIEHGDPRKWNGGFGACVFEVRLELDGAADTGYAQAVRAREPVAVDGRLDEAVWAQAQPLTTFSDRHMKRAPGRGTVFRVAYDDAHWYVSAVSEEPGADGATATAGTHDSPVYADDCVELFFAPPGQQHYYHLAVNAFGVVFDERNAEGGDSWTAGAQVGVRRTEEGWTVELAVPVASMGEQGIRSGVEWRVGLFRDIMEFAQYAAWSCVGGGGYHSPSRFGSVVPLPVTYEALPAVNIDPVRSPRFGRNAASLRLHGPVDSRRHTLDLVVLPVESPSIPVHVQDLDNLNPTRLGVAGVGETGEPLTVDFPIDRYGAARLVASLRERQGGRLVSRAVYSLTLLLQDHRPLELTLRQPYVSTEAELPGTVRVNLAPDAHQDVRVRVSVGDGSRTVWEETVTGRNPAEFAVPLVGLPVGEYTVTCEAMSAAGKAPASVRRPFTKREALGQPRKVRFDARGICHVDGAPVMPLGFMLAPAEAAVVEAGYNAVLYGGETLDGRGGLDAAAENGLLAVLHICNYLRGREDLDAIRAVVSLRKDEPGLFAWYLADEPEAYGDTPEVLRRAYRIIKDIDPNHPVVVLTNAPGMLKRYKGCADVIMADPYPIPDHPLSMVADWTDAAVSAATANGQAAWMTPQGFGYHDLNPESTKASPTREELTNMLLTCLIHGAKGILWWPYSVPRQRYWPHFRKMADLCAVVRPWILFGETPAGMPDGPQVSGAVHWSALEHDGRVLILAANLSRRPASLTVDLPAGAGAVELLRDDVAWSRVGDTVRIALAPVQTAVLRTEAGPGSARSVPGSPTGTVP